MSTFLRNMTPAVLAAAIEGSLFEQFVGWGGWSRAHLDDEGDFVRLVSSAPSAMFNGVFRVRLTGRDLDARIEAALRPFAERGMGAFWMVGPTTAPADLPARLETHGLKLLDDAAGMAAALDAPSADLAAPAALRIVPVRDAASLRRYNDAMNRGFAAPGVIRDSFLDLFTDLGVGEDQPLQHYVGLLNGRPVASSSLLCGAEVAGIYNVATVAEARRRGFGTAMTLAALQAARARGYHIAVLHASEEGIGIYRRLGFQQHCTIRWYAWYPPQRA